MAFYEFVAWGHMAVEFVGGGGANGCRVCRRRQMVVAFVGGQMAVRVCRGANGC